MNKPKEILGAGIFILIIAGWALLFSRISPDGIVEAVGVNNGYAAVFVLAFLGGLSTFTTIPYYLFVATFAAGGLNPFLLGGIAGIAVFLGDSTSYFLGYHGRGILPFRLQNVLTEFCAWCLSHPSWLVPTALFFYAAIAPLSNDFIVISMGLAHFPYWRLMIPLGIGNIVFNTWVALLGSYGYDAFSGFLN